MMPAMDPCPNIYDSRFDYDPARPNGFRRGEHPGFRAAAAGGELTVRLYEVPPGESLCPYHYEYVEEWLLVLEGEAELRTPSGTERLERGAAVRFPPGPSGAHRLSTPPDAGRAARVLMFSSAREPSVAVYPDSDKIGVWTGNPDDDVMLRRSDAGIPYFDGET
jgi:uncharacterized cupin superfamily protein